MATLLCVSLMVCCCISQQNYFIDQRENCNNVYDSVQNVNESSEFIRFLGVFSSTSECIDECLKNSTSNNRCESYTYHTSSFNMDQYKLHCYGRFGSIYGKIWIPIPEENINCGRIIWKCTSNIDCSLNGICSTKSGNCTCNKAWNGYHCQELNLLPATKGNGYHIIDDNNSGMPTSSWGGAVLTDSSNNSVNDSKYHMYCAEFDNHCGVNSWTLNSVVTHAQSTKGWNSPFERVEVLHDHFAHEPDAIYGPNNEIVLYYAAYNLSDTQICNCSDGSTPPSCGPPNKYEINIMQYAEANNFNGPFHRTVIFPNRSPNEPDTNLAGVILKNGTFIGLMRIKHDGSEIHLVTSQDWKNGSKYIQHSNVLFPELTGGLTEDPFLWIDCNGYFHAIFHNESPETKDPSVCGGHAYSLNGVQWIYGGLSFGNIVQFTDNSNVSFPRRERPHLIFDDDQCTPIALTNGVEYGGEYGDATYTLLQPIKH